MVRNQLPAQVFNLLWTSRIFCSKIAIFSQFQVYLSITQAKQIINLLLLNNFYPVIYRRVQKESDELLYTVWSLVTVRNQLPTQVVNLLRWNDVPRTSQNCNIFSVLSILKYSQQIIILLLVNNFYPVRIIPTSSKRKRRIVLYTVWSLVMVRNQLPAQVVN